jgi:hypothetical protein
MLSTVSPEATVIGVPPSQVQWPAGAGGDTGADGRGVTEPVISEDADGGR